MGFEDTVRKSKKIRVYPTAEQRAIFRKWFGVSRFAYNATVEYLKTPGTKANWKGIKGQILNLVPDWAKSVPYQVKSVAVRDACQSVGRAKKKCKSTGKVQQVKFKSRKNNTQSCYIPKSAVSKNGIYYTLTGVLKWSEKVPEDVGDSRLVQENGRWYVCLPVEEQREKTENQGRVVSLDPGVRTFLTFFSENFCGKLGRGDFGRIQRLCAHLDKLQSKISKAKGGQKYRMKEAARRMRWKAKDLVEELHHKSAKFLVDNFDIILLPRFETSKMVMRSKRKIGSKTARAMMTWGHYQFKKFLQYKAFEGSKVVLEVDEAYTTKTVSWTGEVVEIGGRKEIKSLADGKVMDRDYNGARGIYLRALVDQPILTDTFSTFV